MALPIAPVSGASQLLHTAATTAAKSAAAPAGADFSSLLGRAIESVESQRRTADQAIQSLATGGNEDLHTVALSVQRAELSFDLGLQLRNKVVEAYQEVMRMQL